MGDGKPLHPWILKLWVEQEEQQVGWIEKASLNIADKGRAATQMWVPQGQHTLAELRGGKTIGGKEQADQVATIGRLIDVAADGAPEEGNR